MIWIFMFLDTCICYGGIFSHLKFYFFSHLYFIIDMQEYFNNSYIKGIEFNNIREKFIRIFQKFIRIFQKFYKISRCDIVFCITMFT